MSLVNILNVTVLDNPTAFSNPFQFEIQFECVQALDDDLEWKLIYVVDPEDDSKDQVLEEVMVGPVIVGIHKFVLQAPAPDPTRVQDLLGVTVILLTCCYNDQEFVRVGYYVNNEYQYDEPVDPANPPPLPSPIDLNKVHRVILAEEPRVTRFNIAWTAADVARAASGVPLYPEDQGDIVEADGADGEVCDMENEEDQDEDEEDDDDDDVNAEIDLENEDDEENEEDGEEDGVDDGDEADGDMSEEEGDGADSGEGGEDGAENADANHYGAVGTSHSAKGFGPVSSGMEALINEDSVDVYQIQQNYIRSTVDAGLYSNSGFGPN